LSDSLFGQRADPQFEFATLTSRIWSERGSTGSWRSGHSEFMAHGRIILRQGRQL